MVLTQEQQEILNGSKGPVMAKVLKTLVLYGEVFGAEKLVPVTSKYGHIVTSFGVSVIKDAIGALMDELISSGVVSKQQFTADPRPTDPNVPKSFLEDIVFKVMYGPQKHYEEQLQKVGLLSEDSFTCTSYLDEVGNIPQKGDILSWAESSAVNYANSVLGARCNRNSGIIEMFGSIAGYVPYFGLLTDEGRKADWIVEVKTSSLPLPQLLGSAVGMKVLEDVPYVKGLDKWLSPLDNCDTIAYLKNFGAASASNGSVGLYHVEGITPEAKESGEELIKDNAKHYVIDDEEINRIKNSYPIMWKDKNAKPKLCFIGCPHLSYSEAINWARAIQEGLKESGNKKVVIPTVFTLSPQVKNKLKGTEEEKILKASGVILSSICPLMYMNNPLCAKKAVITNSNKLRTYTSSRYYTDEEIRDIITGRK
ncbi:MAG: aconitase X [Sphaerochaetaceae bacterium]|nr:aconitase X [Sphaerochaetaceae bacterium]